jgi:hypothetical protein
MAVPARFSVVCVLQPLDHADAQDYGNAEADNNDDGRGTMEALYFGNSSSWGHGQGPGP